MCAAIFSAWRRKRCAADALGVQPQRRALGRVAAVRQGTRQRFGGEFVAEARLVLKRQAGDGKIIHGHVRNRVGNKAILLLA